MFSSSTFKHIHHWRYALRSSLQLPKIIQSMFWDLLFNFLLSLMIRSEISFPFQTLYHNFATLKEFQKSFVRLSNSAPSLKLFYKIFFPMFYHSTAVDATPQDLPHAIEDMGGIWFATQFWVSGVGVGHYEILPIQPANLKKKRLSSKTDFFKMTALPCMSTSMQHAATHSRLQPLAATRLAANGCKRWHKRKR